MADLPSQSGLGGGDPGAFSGSSRPTAPPSQTRSPAPGIKGPRIIMRERAEREARRAAREREEREEAERAARAEREEAERAARAEQEARQRAAREQAERAARADQEARVQAEQNRRLQEEAREREQREGLRRTAAGAVADVPAQTVDPAVQRRQQRAAEARAAEAAAAATQTFQAAQAQAAAGQIQPGQSRPGDRPAGGQSAPKTTRPPQQQRPPKAAATAAMLANAAQTGETAAGSAQAGETRTRTSFPHAFERWEALSAHWEGLTSFWIRRLQQNSEEIDRDPLSAQLSRQVTDLSAAGANLFHAVVELQRLRASSERKFQRWFYDTRTDLERNRETNAMLEATLLEERRVRADAIRDAVEQERNNSKTQKLLAEMRKELAISKEEARRAWEELGRREQEERERTQSLQDGKPTIVGGVQVVPMTQGVPYRYHSQNPQHASPPDPADRYYEYAQDVDPRNPGVAPKNRSSTGAGGSAAHEQQTYGTASRPGSEGAYSEGEYAIDGQGNFIRDSMGNKIPFRVAGSPGGDSDLGAEEYVPLSASSSPQHQRQRPAPQGYPSETQQHLPESGQHLSPDYAGQGYGAPGWETVPRHRHPTRLSDVIEEDEHSRTSASQVSRP